MNSEPFAADLGWRRLPLPDADILYRRSMRFAQPHAQILGQLIGGIDWQARRVVVWGKEYPQPRLIAWHGDQGMHYRYSRITLQPLPWTDLLLNLKDEVERAVQSTFNGVLLNYYRDGRDRMGLHSDDEPELGSTPTIASLSFGETRTFELRHRHRRDLPPLRVRLRSSSLLLMKGATQQYWKHGIVATRRDCGARVNLSFRRIV